MPTPPPPLPPLQTISAPLGTKQKQEEKGERRGGPWVSACLWERDLATVPLAGWGGTYFTGKNSPPEGEGHSGPLSLKSKDPLPPPRSRDSLNN